MRVGLPIALGVAVAGVAILLSGCGGSTDAAGTLASTAAAQTTPAFEGGLISPRRAAPALRLRDIDGRTVDIRDLRGRPVLVTFVYAHCPDVCPLIMANLRRVRQQGGALGRSVRVIAVSVDPTGDTPVVVRRFLRAQRVGGFVDYLVGTRARLEPVWARWAVAQNVPKSDPELVEHSALIYGITASGELATAYPVGFDAAAIARDLPLLARN